MKTFIAIIIFSTLTFPVFSQNVNLRQRFSNLSDSMENSIARNSNLLAGWVDAGADHVNMRAYAAFRTRYETLLGAMRDSEHRMNFLLRTNARLEFIGEERDNYENLLRLLRELKTEYDAWLRTVR